MRPRPTTEDRKKFAEARALGSTIKQSAVFAGINYDTGRMCDRKAKLARGEPTGRARKRITLCPEAEEALLDFGLFRRRYFGRIASSWQEEAAYKMFRLLD